MAYLLVILIFVSACAKLDEPKGRTAPRTSWLSDAAKKEAKERAEKRAEVRSEVQAKVRKELQAEEKVAQKETPAAAPQPQAPEVKAQPQPEPAKPQLTELNITESPEGIRVAVGSTSLLQYTSYMLESPPRLTIDIFGAGVGALSQPMEIGKDPVKKIHAAYMEDKDIARVEIELTSAVPYDITRDKNSIVVSLPTKPAEPEPAEKPPAIKLTDLRYREIEGMVRLEADFSGQNPHYKAVRLKDPLRLVLEITDAVVEKEQEIKPEKPLGALKGISLTQSEAKGRPAARIVALLTELTPYVVYQEGSTIKMDVESPSLRPIAAEGPPKAQAQIPKGEKAAPATTPKTPTPPPAPEEKMKEVPTPGKPGEKYTGSKISLDFQDAELTDILRLLAEVSGLNIITGPRVSAKVNIKMQDVPWDQALNLILRSNDYDFLQEGSVLWIDQKTVIEREKETRKLEQEARAKEEARKTEEAKPTEAKAERAPEKKEQYVTRIFSVNYVATTRSGTGILQTAKAGEGEEGGGGSTINTEDKPDIWGTIVEGLNTILFGAASTETARSQEGKRLIINKFAGIIQVTTSPDQMADVAEFLKTVEGSFLRQVMVEAHIVEVLLSENFQMGIDWTLVGRIAGDLRGGLAGGILAQQKLVGAGVPTDVPTDLFRFAVTNENINIILDAISTQGNINTLSNPKISTLNNQKAVMKVGTEEVVFDVTTTVSQGISVNSATARTVTVGVVLDVTPNINPDGKITMVVHPNITELLSIEREPRTGVSAPRVSTRETNTIVTLDNNQTLILAGLIRDRTEKTRIGVPFLSKVPLFGAAFRQSVKTKAKSELVIFITPTIIEGGKITELSAEQVKSLQRAPQRFFK